MIKKNVSTLFMHKYIYGFKAANKKYAYYNVNNKYINMKKINR